MENLKSGSLKRKLLTLLLPIHFLVISSPAQIGFTVNYIEGSCTPQVLMFENSSSVGDNYFWDFGDGNTSTETNPTHTYLHGGIYDVRLTAYTGTTPIGEFHHSLTFKGGPNRIYFNSDSICPGEVVSMYTTTDAIDYTWVFEDSSIIIGNHAEHQFDSIGFLKVQLITNTICGQDSITDSIYVSTTAKPDADFWFNNPVCPNDMVQLHANNWLAKDFSWTFGDGDSASGRDTVHSYSMDGTYEITLTTTNQCGQSNSLTKLITIENNVPVGDHINIEANKFTVCPNEPVNFATNHTGSCFWRFGDGKTSTKREAVQSYLYPGEYVVSLVITNGCGNKDTLYATITVTPDAPFGGNPAIEKSASQICPGDWMSFNSSMEAYSYSWDFGDGITSNQRELTHSWMEPGKKYISLTLTNICGKDTTLVDSVMVGGDIKPDLYSDMFGATSYKVCPGDSVIFFAMGGASYNWHFGDGGSSSKTSVLNTDGFTVDIIKHSYAISGTYNITLDYFNTCGNSTTGELTIEVGDTTAATADMEILNSSPYTCDPIKIIGMGGTEFIWNFGDGLIDTIQQSDIIHSYPIQGEYTVELIVINGCGNKDTISNSIHVKALPEPVINTMGATMTVTDDAKAYQWLKDGTPIAEATSETYTAPVSGLYSVAVTYHNGCTVLSPPFMHCFAIAGEDLTICTDGFVTLNASGGSDYSWSPAEGLSNTTLHNPTANPVFNTEYVVTVTEGACVATDTVMVNVVTEISVDAGEDVYICEGDSVQLFVTGNGSYYWSSEETLNDAYIAKPFAKPEFTTSYSVTVSNGSCESTDTVVVNVNPLPTVYAGENKKICIGEPAVLIGSGSPGNYTWMSSEWIDSTSDEIIIVYPKSTTIYYLTITDENGCSNIDSMEVLVNALPSVDAGEDLEVCAGSSVLLSGNGEGGLDWHPTTGLNNPYLPGPLATPDTTITYYLTATNNGCTNQDSVKVIVRSTFVSIEHMDNFLQATSGFSKYQWYIDNELMIEETIDIIEINPGESHEYSVIASDEFGCSDSASISIILTDHYSKLNSAKIMAYPNPATESITIRYELPESSDVSIQLINIYGNKVMSIQGRNVKGLQNQNINTSDLPPGTYVIQISSKNISEYYKIDIIR